MGQAVKFKDNGAMQMLFDSDAFVVLRLTVDTPLSQSDRWSVPFEGFEILDKHAGKEVFLSGAWAELFEKEVRAWMQNGSDDDEIELILQRYAALAQNPVVPH